MTPMHGIIYAFHSYPELGPLQLPRTAASLPFCGRYKLIDFSLSSMMNAGVRDVGVIMQRDYQSLLDHLRGGKEWNLSRRDGGLRMLPPFGVSNSNLGEYKGCMEALSATKNYLSEIRQDYIVLTKGNLIANLELSKAYESHVASGKEITAICTQQKPASTHHRYIVKDNTVSEAMYSQSDSDVGVASLEVYIINKSTLLELVDYCSAHRLVHFHRDAIKYFLGQSREMNIFMHEGYCSHVETVRRYYETSMDMLNPDLRNDVFCAERPVQTKEHADLSAYYGEFANVKNSLIADGCRIEGDLENCLVFRGAVVEEGASLKNCVLMQDTHIMKNTKLAYTITDKYVSVSEGVSLSGSPVLPLIVPKYTKL